MNKISQLILEEEIIRGGQPCDITDPECFFKEYYPKAVGLDSLLDADVSFLNSQYSSVRDIYNEYVDQSLAGSVVMPKQEGLPEEIQRVEDQIKELEDKISELPPEALELLEEMIDNPEGDLESAIEKMFNLNSGDLEKDQDVMDKASNMITKITKSATNLPTTTRPGTAKKIIEKVTPIQSILAARYLSAVNNKKENVDFIINLPVMSTVEIETALGAGELAALAANIGRTPMGMAIDAGKGLMLDVFLSNFGAWTFGAITFICSTLSMLLLNYIAGMFATFEIEDLLMILAEIGVSAAIGFGVGGALAVVARARNFYVRFKRVWTLIKKMMGFSNNVDKKVVPAAVKIAKIIKTASPSLHREMCAEAAKGYPKYSSADVDRILSGLEKRNNKILNLKRYLLKNGFKEELSMLK